MNGRELRPQPPPEIVLGSGGAVRLSHRYSGTFSSPLDLRDFPFDRQRLAISFASIGYGPEEISYALAPATARAEPFSVAGWEISNFESWTDDVTAISGDPGRGRSHARFHYALDAERHPGGYFVRAIVPLCLIVFMAYAVFWIDPSQTAPQIGVATTSMLTTIAFLFALQHNLPPVPYLTRLDHFIYGCLVLVFLAFAEAILTTGLTGGGRHAAALNLDRIMRGLFPASVLLLAWVALF